MQIVRFAVLFSWITHP